MTNGDYIRSLTDDELGEYLCIITSYGCYHCEGNCDNGNNCTRLLKEWLKQERESNDKR